MHARLVMVYINLFAAYIITLGIPVLNVVMLLWDFVLIHYLSAE